jgi:proline dehydrogenase
MLPPVARRFVAGETVPEALEHARVTNADGVKVILNHLGEHYRNPTPVIEDTEAYVDLLADLDGSGLDACVSVKPSQLGLDVSEPLFRRSLRRVVEAGDRHGRFVWIDMEDATTTDATLDGFEALAREFDGGVGVCVQANLRRTRADLERLVDVPGKVRLVKGAYDEPESRAYTRKDEVDAAFRDDLDFLVREHTGGVAVGSHDPSLIEYAKQLHADHGGDLEFQLLMGVREAAQRALAAEGYEVWQYAPYGQQWLAYFSRRVRERRENLAFALRAIAGVLPAVDPQSR